MLKLDFEVLPETELKMKRVLEHYPDKEVFFQDIIKNRVNELKIGIQNIEIDLKEFEQKYQLSSNDFYHRFKNGDLEDIEDFILWSGLLEMQKEDKKQ